MKFFYAMLKLNYLKKFMFYSLFSIIRITVINQQLSAGKLFYENSKKYILQEFILIENLK